MIQLFALLALVLATDDKKEAPPASLEWEGTCKAIKLTTTSTGKKSTKHVNWDLRIVIQERKGEKFTGEYWTENGKNGFGIAGTLDKQGNLEFKFTKKLKGTWPSDMIDNAVVRGVVRQDQLVAKYSKQGNEIITGDIVAKKKAE